MRLDRSQRAHAMIPTASMADIAFLLIIFFMVTTVYDVDRSQVRLPLSGTRSEAAKGSAVVVIEKAGATGGVVYRFSDGKRMSRTVGGAADLYLEASRITYGDPARQFVVKADATIRYAVVDDVLDQLRSAGVQNVLLLTRPKGVEGIP